MIVASHRGPESFDQTEGGGFERRRGAGGLVSALRPLLAGSDTKWVAAPVTDDDRAARAAGAAVSDEFDLHLLDLDPRLHHLHYHVVSNAVLWFLHHGLFDLPRRPVFDLHFREAWEAYVAVNRAYADEIVGCADDGDTVLVQDYQLALVPGMLAAQRPDLAVVSFQHTPFCGPNSVRVLPADVGAALMEGLGAAPAGFHTSRWVRSYRASAMEMLGREAPAFAAPLGPDPAALAETAASEEVAADGAALDELLGDRQVVLRVDRIELSKNIVRGFKAFDLLLETEPRWRERVTFLALVYPSREALADYLAYRQEVEQAAAAVNARWATGDWTPVVIDMEDRFSLSVAGMQRYDVLLVNPVRDGLNLVAKEAPLVNRRDGVVALSRDAGAFEELQEAVVEVHPYDVAQTAEALSTALSMPADERAARAKHIRELAEGRTAKDWLDDLLVQAQRVGQG